MSAPEVFHELGHLTRQLHDSLERLAGLSQLKQSAEGLSDARSRLHYIAHKSGEAADKVLTAVEVAKQESAVLAQQVRSLGDTAFEAGAERSLDRIDRQLTDIMLAQDFHDLTGQVVKQVVALASDLERDLVKLLVRVAPHEAASRPADNVALAGPVVAAIGRTDVVNDQAEVDALLADLGF
jgi:chemotaxis protein CheZ